ncbi:MAG: UvrD-helicase domain-containing protein [Acidimicrobiia bacterium]|nr:UvrD-helicase domain-containing protein [Acidimicrobiia bacterium]
MDELDGAAISTLHAFAQRILSEHPIEVGLPPSVDVHDEVSSQLAFEDRWAALYDSLFDRADLEPTMRRMLATDIRQDHLEAVARTFDDNWDQLRDRRLEGREPEPLDLTPLLAEYDAIVAECAHGAADDPLVEFVRDDLAGHLDVLRDAEELVAIRWLCEDLPKPGNKGRKGNWPDDYPLQELRDRVRALDDIRRAVLDDVRDQVLRRLSVELGRACLEAAGDRRRQGVLEFHDLLVLARELLRTSPAARRSLRRRYTHLLLDEFQDTDPIQVELAVLIASGAGAGAGDGDTDRGSHDGSDEPADRGPGAWDDLTPDEGALFFVGDPKQSIYRFRRADIALFLRARDRFAPDGPTGLVETSAPSRASSSSSTGSSASSSARATDFPTRVHAASRPSRPRSPTSRRRSRSSAVPTKVPAPPSSASSKPPTSPRRSCAPSTRSGPFSATTGPSSPADRPTSPCCCPPGRPSASSRPSSDGSAFPSAPRPDPSSGTARRSATSSTSSGPSTIPPTSSASSPRCAPRPSAAATTTSSTGTTPSVAGTTGSSGPGRCRAIIPSSRLWGGWRRATTSAGGPDRASSSSGWRASVVCSSSESSTDVPATCGAGSGSSSTGPRAFVESEGGDLRGFLEWARLQTSDVARPAEPVLPEADDDAVRILTIHGAKGREFPVTILSGLTTRPRRPPRRPQVLWPDEGPPEISLNKQVATEHFAPEREAEEQMDEHEKLRLLYVGATRARDHLVLATHHKAGDRSFACRIRELVDDLGHLWVAGAGDDGTVDALAPDRAPPPDPAVVRADWLSERAVVLDRQRVSRAISATELARDAAGGDRAGPDAGPETDDEAVAAETSGGGDDALPRPATRGRAGTAIGRAVHAVLQYVDLATGDGLEALADAEAATEGIVDRAGTIAARARGALDAPIVRTAVEGGEYWRELYVAALADDHGADTDDLTSAPLVVEGYVDLLVRTPEGLVVVDYKTDGVRSEAEADEALARYRLQGAAYALALERASGETVTACVFLFLGDHGAFERRVDDLAAAVAEVGARGRRGGVPVVGWSPTLPPTPTTARYRWSSGRGQPIVVDPTVPASAASRPHRTPPVAVTVLVAAVVVAGLVGCTSDPEPITAPPTTAEDTEPGPPPDFVDFVPRDTRGAELTPVTGDPPEPPPIDVFAEDGRARLTGRVTGPDGSARRRGDGAARALRRSAFGRRAGGDRRRRRVRRASTARRPLPGACLAR